MVLLARKCLAVTFPSVHNIRTVFGRTRIGCREVVGYGMNGGYNYKDDPLFPFPAIRFKENSQEIMCLRQKEKLDWRQLSCEEKKALYRASFCQTFVEFQHPTGQWKFILGWCCVAVSFGFWGMMFSHYYVNEPLPSSFSKSSQRAQLQRMLDLRVNPIDGISSKWDYDKNTWKVAIVLAIIGMSIANPVPPIGLTSLAHVPLVVPVSVSSSVVNHGVSLPHVPYIPLIKPVVLPVTWWGNGLGWNKHWH